MKNDGDGSGGGGAEQVASRAHRPGHLTACGWNRAALHMLTVSFGSVALGERWDSAFTFHSFNPCVRTPVTLIKTNIRGKPSPPSFLSEVVSVSSDLTESLLSLPGLLE